MKKIFFILTMVALFPMAMLGQAKKPTIMVIPSDVWCSENGLMITAENLGNTDYIPDYEQAVLNADLMGVITKINGLMAERGMPLKDMSQTMKSIKEDQALRDQTLSSTSGATVAYTTKDVLLDRAKADIIIEVGWQLHKKGPQKELTYSLRALDAYTNKQIAENSGTMPPSYSATVPVLLEEAVLEKMDGFVSQLQAFFDDLFANGREISVRLLVFDGTGISFEDEFDGEELTDMIDNWMYENTVSHRYNLSMATEYRLDFEQVRIPLYDERGRAMDARRFINNLRKYLRDAPFNITSKNTTSGLGKAELILGEK